MLEEIRRHPDELSSFEYLNEHLKEEVLQGGYESEFQIVKANILACRSLGDGRSVFNEFKSFKHLLETTTQESLCNIKETVVREVVELYQRREDLRPSSGVVLIMVLWGRLAKIAPGEWFDDGVYWLLEEAQLINADDPGIVDSLIAVVRKKMHGKRFYETRKLKERVVELEEDEEEIIDDTENTDE